MTLTAPLKWNNQSVEENHRNEITPKSKRIPRNHETHSLMAERRVFSFMTAMFRNGGIKQIRKTNTHSPSSFFFTLPTAADLRLNAGGNSVAATAHACIYI